jgi:ketosteroid isomerase-like protein
MKVKLISFVSIAFLAGISCTSSIDVKKEKEAIISVIEEEADAFYARDFDRLTAAHVPDETDILVDVERYGHTISRGRGDTSLKDYLLENPEPHTNYERKANFQIRVYPGCAWAVYDNDAYSSKGQLLDRSVHIQFLEKVRGRWKIAHMAIVNDSSF